MGCDPEGKLFYGFPITTDEDEKLEESETFNQLDDDEKIGLGLAGYESELSHFIYVKASHSRSEWGDMIELGEGDFRVDPKWEQQMRLFCDREGIVFRKPKLYLTSLYF